MFLVGSATVFLLIAGPVVSGRAFANVCLCVSDFLGCHPSDPKNSVHAKCLELQMKSWKDSDNLLGEKKINHPVIGACHTLYGETHTEQLISESAVKSGL